MLLALIDVLLALGCTMRLTRLITTDHLGRWWIGDPATLRANHGRHRTLWGYIDALVHCPYCIGFWIGNIVLTSLYLTGGPGDTTEPWRWVTGAFTLNYVAAHIGVRLGDTGDDE